MFLSNWRICLGHSTHGLVHNWLILFPLPVSSDSRGLCLPQVRTAPLQINLARTSGPEDRNIWLIPHSTMQVYRGIHQQVMINSMQDRKWYAGYDVVWKTSLPSKLILQHLCETKRIFITCSKSQCCHSGLKSQVCHGAEKSSARRRPMPLR